jgi:GGDEF domain-containing protein
MQDTAYRYAGDEFTIILPETELEKATAVAERVRCGRHLKKGLSFLESPLSYPYNAVVLLSAGLLFDPYRHFKQCRQYQKSHRPHSQ